MLDIVQNPQRKTVKQTKKQCWIINTAAIKLCIFQDTRNFVYFETKPVCPCMINHSL